jgi:hypothetical protein
MAKSARITPITRKTAHHKTSAARRQKRKIPTMRKPAAIALLSVSLVHLHAQSPAPTPPLPRLTAKEAYAEFQQRAAAARKAEDKPARLAAILQMRTLLNDAPDAVEASAEAYLAAGDTRQALNALSQFTQQGQSDDTILDGTDKHFSAIHDLGEYKSIVARMTQNTAPISHAEPAFTLADSNILPEDIAYDPKSKSFLITSVLQHKILRVTEAGKASDFAPSPSRWPMMAIKVDPARNLVWATEVAIDTFTSVPEKDRGKSAILCFDLATGALRRRIEGPPNSALADMALLPNGDPILADGQSGILYRLEAGHLKPINTTDFISPQTPAPLPNGKHILIPDYLRGIAILNLETNQTDWLPQLLARPPEIPAALNGTDGLYLAGNTVLLTQNGTNPERTVRLHLDTSLHHILREEIIERSTPTLGDPTHGIIVGSDFYYIANSGWNHLDNQGNPKPNSPPTPAKVMRFPLH